MVVRLGGGLLVSLSIVAASSAPQAIFTGPVLPAGGKDVLSKCSKHFMSQVVDHFGPSGMNQTYLQRYFLCDATDAWVPGDPVFIYLGNEADVELYVNATGLMWEWAPEFRARLVFVEHRYFGESTVPELPGQNPLAFLTVDQALGDYANFARVLRREVLQAPNSAIVGFGGSYGGMLCAWLRSSAPWAIDACLAASAPVMSFMGLDPPVNANFFAQIVSSDASAAGGSAETCRTRIHAAWPSILQLGTTAEGLQQLAASLQLCKVPEDPWEVIFWLSSAFDYMAMGSYPYPSSYMLNGRGVLPAYPLRQACAGIASAPADVMSQLKALRSAVAIFYNATDSGPHACFDTQASGNNETTEDARKWNYLYCSGIFQVSGRDGVNDMYWNSPWNPLAEQQSCQSRFGLWPDPEWVAARFGGWRIAQTTSRILFSNGGLDPWSGGGVTRTLAAELPAIVIPEVGHHIDLFWSHPDDPPAVKEARSQEKTWIHRWVQSAAQELSASRESVAFV